MEDEEFKQEKMNMLKGLFPIMRTWYHTEEVKEIRQKYGEFPLFWQDLEDWKHLKILQKLFLTVTERKEAGLPYGSVVELEANLLQKNQGHKDYDNIEEKNEVKNEVRGETVTGSNEIEVKRKKKSRWDSGTKDQNEVSVSATTTVSVITESTENNDNDVKKPRKSRWSAQDSSTTPTPLSNINNSTALGLAGLALPAPVQPPVLTAEQMQQMVILKMQLQQINERLLTVAQDAARIELDPNRSPSPPPKYDSMGKRTNTRVIRMRDELIQERGRLIEQLMKINPTFAGPLTFMRSKPVKKIPIPAAQLPNQSFIGLIIGPRGNTQKQMEMETGCKISIKGKGMRGSANAPGEEEEDLHVHITGDDEAGVERAAQMVMALLHPQSEDAVQAHKEKQLRELVRKSLLFDSLLY
jgi:splicing factor 1